MESLTHVEKGPVVYLIHLQTPLKHARHYLGFSNNLQQRILIHRSRHRDSCSFMKAVNLAGIQWEVVRLWIGEERSFERKLKRYANVSRYCPICREKALSKAKHWIYNYRKKLLTSDPNTYNETICH